MSRLPDLALEQLRTVAAEAGHAELTIDTYGPGTPDYARCPWCHAQAAVTQHGTDTVARGYDDLTTPCPTWCARCDLVTRDEIHSGTVTTPGMAGHLGLDQPDGRWLCPRCAPAETRP